MIRVVPPRDSERFSARSMATMRPSWMINTRSHTWLTSPRMCDDRNTVCSPPSARMICPRLHDLPRVDANRWFVENEHWGARAAAPVRSPRAVDSPSTTCLSACRSTPAADRDRTGHPVRDRMRGLARPRNAPMYARYCRDGHVRVERDRLRQVADCPPGLQRLRLDVMTRDRCRPRGGGVYPVRIRIVVVLPAPLGPRNPTTSPDSARKLTSSIAG